MKKFKTISMGLVLTMGLMTGLVQLRYLQMMRKFTRSHVTRHMLHFPFSRMMEVIKELM